MIIISKLFCALYTWHTSTTELPMCLPEELQEGFSVVFPETLEQNKVKKLYTNLDIKHSPKWLFLLVKRIIKFSFSKRHFLRHGGRGPNSTRQLFDPSYSSKTIAENFIILRRKNYNITVIALFYSLVKGHLELCW